MVNTNNNTYSFFLYGDGDQRYYISNDAKIVYDSQTDVPLYSPWYIAAQTVVTNKKPITAILKPASFLSTKYLKLVENNNNNILTYTATLSDLARLSDLATCDLSLQISDCSSDLTKNSCPNSLSCFYLKPNPKSGATLMYVYYNNQLNQVCINTDILPTENNASVPLSFTLINNNSTVNFNTNEQCEYFLFY